MEEHCLNLFAAMAKKMEISLDELFSITNWLMDKLEFSVDDLDNNFFEDLTIYSNIDDAIRANIEDDQLGKLLRTSKEAYLEANDMLELASLKIVHLIDKF